MEKILLRNAVDLVLLICTTKHFYNVFLLKIFEFFQIIDNSF